MGENHFAAAPTTLYGAVLLMAAIAYYILQQVIISSQGKNSMLKAAIGNDLKGKISPILYVIALAFSFWIPLISLAIYILVAIFWLIPDKRIERVM